MFLVGRAGEENKFSRIVFVAAIEQNFLYARISKSERQLQTARHSTLNVLPLSLLIYSY